MRKVLVIGIVALSMLFGSIAASAQDEWVPALGSFVLPGLGQLINDQVDKAITHFIIDLGIWGAGITVAYLVPPVAIALPIVALGWRIYSGLDAYNVAKDQGFSIGLVENGVRVSYGF